MIWYDQGPGISVLQTKDFASLCSWHLFSKFFRVWVVVSLMEKNQNN